MERPLPEKSKPGRTRCLRCRKCFKSPDRLRIRICPPCKAKQDDAPALRTIPTAGLRLGLADE